MQTLSLTLLLMPAAVARSVGTCLLELEGNWVHTDLSMERGMVAATAKVPLSKALTP